MVNTDGPAWGGSLSDLDAVVVSVGNFLHAGAFFSPVVLQRGSSETETTEDALGWFCTTGIKRSAQTIVKAIVGSPQNEAGERFSPHLVAMHSCRRPLCRHNEGAFQEARKEPPADRGERHHCASDADGAGAGKGRGGHDTHRLCGERARDKGGEKHRIHRQAREGARGNTGGGRGRTPGSRERQSNIRSARDASLRSLARKNPRDYPL